MQTFTKHPGPKDGHTVGGCVGNDGEPVYFHIPNEATNHEAAAMAFEAKHGREPDRVEWEMLAMIERHRGPANA